MNDLDTFRRTGFVLALALATAACAQQQAPAPAQQSGAMSGMAMQGHDMSRMDMQQMMAHCARMRQQRRQGAAMSQDMQQMMGHCDQMDRQMGSSPGVRPARP